jgi:hypothetical protein
LFALNEQSAGRILHGLERRRRSRATFDSLADQIRQAFDILVDGTQDPNQTCNGISIGLGRAPARLTWNPFPAAAMNETVSSAGGSLAGTLWLVPLISGALTFSTAVGAQDDQARARELFAEGRQDVVRGDLQAACDKFSASHALAPDAVGPLLNLADCDERAGKVATAWRRLERAAELADDEEQRAYAQRRAEALADRVPWLRIELPPQVVAEVTTEREGERVDIGEPGKEHAVDPGRYTFVVRAPGRTDRVEEIDLREGERRTVVLEIDPSPPTSPAPPTAPTPRPFLRPPLPAPPRDEGTNSMATAGWIIGSIGATATTVGIATGIAVAVNAGIYDDHCDAQDRCDSEGLAAAERGQPLAIVSPVMLTLGVVGIGVALPLLLIDDDDVVQVTLAPNGMTLSGAF